ncbi:MAG: hypothetical protein JNK15_08375 [Planctomycetes bacterium]|nr:hypothetical protein [Planctomycetota bacterium]
MALVLLGAVACTGTQPDATAPKFVLKPTGDADLDALQRLAVEAPLDELFAHAAIFQSLRTSPYPKDPILWHGVDRMTREIIDNKNRRVDPLIVGSLIQAIAGTARPADDSLRDRIPALRARKLELEATGDAVLDELRRLVRYAPIEEFLQHAPRFLATRNTSYPQDANLWMGVWRMARAVSDGRAESLDKQTLESIAAAIEGDRRPESPSLREFLPTLKLKAAVAPR